MTTRIEIIVSDARADSHVAQQLEAIMAALDDLRVEVAKNRDVTESAILLLQGLKQRLDDAIASGDPAAIAQLAIDLGSETQRLADAVAANT